MTDTVAVTGASGFVGGHLCALIERQGRRVIRIVRQEARDRMDQRVVTDITDGRELSEALRGADSVIHLAARAHVLRETHVNPLNAFREINVGGVKALSMAARIASVQRIVFVSSIGVNGANTHGRAFTEQDPAQPVEPYAISKWEAEEVLRTEAQRLGLRAVVVRPSLVYGAGVPGNFLRLLRLASSGVPLPLASLHNRRNIVGVENLCELLLLCADRPLAGQETYLAAEAQVHSTTSILEALYRNLGRPSRLFAVPENVLRGLATIGGFRRGFEKLCGSLEVCSEKARAQLGWTPRLSFEEGIQRTTTWYLGRRST